MSESIRWLTRETLDRLLDRLASETELIGPVEVEGEVLFLPVRDPAEMTWDYVNAHVPPKEYFLPTPEPLVAYRVENGVPRLETDEPPAALVRERVIFGIRSCDVAGVAYLDRYFSGAMFERPDLADAHFVARREATTLISVVCDRPGPTCMCVCCEGGPALERGYDWQLTRLEDGWLVEIGSARGERLAARMADLLSPALDGAVEEKTARVRSTVDRFSEFSAHRVPTMAAARMASTGKLDAAFWRVVGDRCFECGGCAFVCPTCWCFNVADVTGMGESDFDSAPAGVSPMVPGGVTESIPDGNWERVRLRDSCTLAGFVRQAGGGYPRLTCGERCLTRFFHKLSEQFHVRMEAHGCSGCGRCINACLGEEGIDAVAEAMRDALTGRGRASAHPARIPVTARRAESAEVGS